MLDEWKDMNYPIVSITCGRCGKAWIADDNSCFAPSCACNKEPEYTELTAKEETRPFTCPVCVGRGTVVAGFYEAWGTWTLGSFMGCELCRSCGGKGIVWKESEA